MADPYRTQPLTRRGFLGVAAALILARPAAARPAPVVHPEPRRGITARLVLDPASVPASARPAYEAARAIPSVLDGLYCHCECAERDGLRSLLSCFETRMPVECSICLGEARLVHRLHRQGRTLSQIRRGVDERYK